jgi:hypothetical protein
VKQPTKAVKVYSVKYGDTWRGQCAVCGWHSGDLPFPTKRQAEHVVDLHAVLCKGPRK